MEYLDLVVGSQVAQAIAVTVGVGIGFVLIGRFVLHRGEVSAGWLFSDHLSCRSLSWLDLFGRGVSYPGGAKPKHLRQTTSGRWKKNQALVEPGWRYLGAEASHAHSERELRKLCGETLHLTGEAAGRQTWVFDDQSSAGNASKHAPPPVAGPTFTFHASDNPNAGDRIFRAQREREWTGPRPDQTHRPRTATEAARKGIQYMQILQCDDGHFAGDYGGPMFLMPGFIIACYVTGVPLGPRAAAMVAYLRNQQQADGGWGTHIESPSTMFGTVLNYVALRLLGVPSDDGAAAEARAFILKHGGAIQCPSWAKFWLCVLGVHEWEGINSIPAEMWCLPLWFPFHPGKLWCHCRMVYLPMCWLYCQRFQFERKYSDPLLAALRRELYTTPYEKIRWWKERHTISPLDNYSPVTLLQRTLHNILVVYETFLPVWKLPPFRWIRNWGIRIAGDYMCAEDEQTNHIDIGPVNKSLNMLCRWAMVNRGRSWYAPPATAASTTSAAAAAAAAPLRKMPSIAPGSEAARHAESFWRHVGRIDDYLWVAEDGMKMQGYNGSQCWDTSFAIQAVVDSGLAAEFPAMCRKALSFFERTQILSTPVSMASPAAPYESLSLRRQYFRHVSKGGWPFSTSAHGWPISDCTAEGLKALLALIRVEPTLPAAPAGGPPPSDGGNRAGGWGGDFGAGKWSSFPEERLRDAAHVLFTLQNSDGGWATYENNRGHGFYEWLNPSEVFGDIMIDYSYVECTSASIQALVSLRARLPHFQPDKVASSIARGGRFVERIQRPDGSWYGSWGVCFLYGTWFGLTGLAAAGYPPSHPAVRRAVAFILSYQNDNGGWGETYKGCVNKAPEGGGGAAAQAAAAAVGRFAPSGGQAAGAELETFGQGGSGVVQTAWAVLGLMAAGVSLPEEVAAAERGVRFLMQRQQASGDWEQEAITGVFNRSCGITYTAYRNAFPVWALGRFDAWRAQRAAPA